MAIPSRPGYSNDMIGVLLAAVLLQRCCHCDPVILRAAKDDRLERQDCQTIQQPPNRYSTVTDLARLRGLSTSVPRANATW